jgi:hypothetical protein
MKRIRQHIPNFFDGFIPKMSYFNTEEELYNIDFLKRWSDSPDFLYFKLSGNLLIAFMKEYFLVVGHIEEV